MKTTDYKLYSYKMKHDNRFAPNPLLGQKSGSKQIISSIEKSKM